MKTFKIIIKGIGESNEIVRDFKSKKEAKKWAQNEYGNKLNVLEVAIINYNYYS